MQQPNPHIDWAASPVQVPTTVMPWPQAAGDTAGERMAGLSSFGLSGANAHLILAAAPPVQVTVSPSTRSHHLLTLSAKSEQALYSQAQAYLVFFADQPTIDLENVCHTTHVGRSHFAHRLSITAESVAQMQTNLAAYLNGQIEANVSQGVIDSRQAAPKVAFLFTGQGTQYLQMGRTLYDTQPVFRWVLDRCEAVAHECLGRSLLELLYPATPPAHNDLLEAHSCGQAANFALECALAELWRSWGVTPDLVLGHSLGDFAAAYTAGVFSLEDGLRLVSMRGRLMEMAIGNMVSVLASAAEVAPFVAPYPQVAIAVLNGPESVVISGEERAITTITAQLQTAGFKTRLLSIPVAAHSPLLEPVLADFEAAVRGVALAQPKLPVVSSMTGQLVTYELTDPIYWRQHLRQPVHFAVGVQTLLEQGATCFVEIGPKPTLLGLVEDVLDGTSSQAPKQVRPGLLPSLRENYADWEQMLESLGALYVQGYPINWQAVDQDYASAKVRLPTYAFQRQSYWVKPKALPVAPATSEQGAATGAAAAPHHTNGHGAGIGPIGTATGMSHSPLNGKRHDAATPGSTSLPPSTVAGPTKVRPTPPRSPMPTAKLPAASVERLLQQQLQVTQRVISEQLAFLRGQTPTPTAKRPAKPQPNAGTPPMAAPAIPSSSPTAQPSASVTHGPLPAQPRQIPVTAAQHQLWLLGQISPQGALAYHERLLVQFDGRLDVAALQQAFQQVVDRHEALRATLSADGQWQTIQPTLKIELPVHTLSAAEMAAWLDGESRQPFDFTNGPLLRATLLQLTPQKQLLVFTAHHIVIDGISLSIFVDELTTLYAAFVQGQAVGLPQAQQFSDYVQWQADQEQSSEFQAQAAYWLTQLSGALPVLTLPTDHAYPPIKSYQGGRHTHVIAPDLAQVLKRNGQQQGCTTFMTLLAAYMAFLHRLTGQDDLLVGIPTAGRGLAGSESVVGYCTHLLPIRSQLHGTPPFVEYLRYLKRELLDAYDHSDYPYAKLLDRLQLVHEASRTPLLSTTFNLDKPTPTAPLAGLTLSFPPAPRPFVHFDLMLNILETPDQWVMEWNYNADILESATVERWIGHFVTFLTDIVTNPSQKVSHLALLSPAERHQLLMDWNNTTTDYPKNKCLHHLFEEQVARTPDAVAVVMAGEEVTRWQGDKVNSPNAVTPSPPHPVTLSYSELNARANQLAHHLQSLGVGPEVLVGICVERSIEMVIGLLGILKAGGAYVPLDPTYPPERLAYMLTNAQAPLLLTQASLLARLPAQQARAFCLDSEWETIAHLPIHAPVTDVTAENLAYVIYTSGSTGQPKGAMNIHRAVCNRLLWMQDEYQLTPNDKILQKTPFSFDVSVWEFFWPLLAGATLVMAKPEGHKDSAYLVEVIRQHGITTLHFVPSMLQMFVEEPGVEACHSLKRVICSGEALPFALQERFFARLPVELHNLYGPTEAAVDVTYWQCRPHSTMSIVPIGRPVANTQMYILDRYQQPTPIGVAGELHIGGIQVGRGYWQRQALTAEKFIDNPFGSGKLYKTGDLARYLPDGAIEYLGRMDHQVKIRGFRIELGEIETVLLQHPAVSEAVVVAREDQPGEKRLVAYVVLKPERSDQSSALRDYLQTKLPDYMTPAAFVVLDAFPLTPNGKTDRKALPAPDWQKRDNATVRPPRTPTEATLVEIWRTVLRLEEVSIDDNFFTIGGDSILSIQVAAQARQAGLALTPHQIFQYQTIYQLATVVEVNIRPQAEQTVVTGPLPLTPIQQWFLAQAWSAPHHFNQAVMLETTPMVNTQWLAQALNTLLSHHDTLRLRFTQTDAGWTQFNAPAEETVAVEVIDLSATPAAERPQQLLIEANRAQASLDLAHGPLLRALFFRYGAGEAGRLLLIIHHLAVDGVSWRILLEDLQTAYAALSRGAPMQLPAKTTSFHAWAHWLAQHGVTMVAAQQAYWRDVVAPQDDGARHPYGLPLDDPSGLAANTVASREEITVGLTASETWSLLHEAAAAYHTQINDLLLAALVQCIGEWSGETSVLFDLEGHGRDLLDAQADDVAANAALDLSRTVGWFTALFPVRLAWTHTEPGELIKSVKEQLRRIPQRGIGYGILRYLGQDQMLIPAMPPALLFNYLGQFDPGVGAQSTAALVHGFAHEPSGLAQSPAGQRTHLLEIDGMIVNGELRFTWGFSRHTHRQATIAQVAQRYCDILRSLIEHCLTGDAGGYTPSDFPELGVDQAALDSLLAEVQSGLEE
ncbi:MAG: amino acid adenylation domain-containing protein [Caldilineaceae bacterium]